MRVSRRESHGAHRRRSSFCDQGRDIRAVALQRGRRTATDSHIRTPWAVRRRMPASSAQRAIVVHDHDLYREPDVTDLSIGGTPDSRYQGTLIVLSGRAFRSVGKCRRRCQCSLTGSTPNIGAHVRATNVRNRQFQARGSSRHSAQTYNRRRDRKPRLSLHALLSSRRC